MEECPSGRMMLGEVGGVGGGGGGGGGHVV